MASKTIKMKRRKFANWDEAFRGLVPAVRQESVRVASYTQALFIQACAGKFGTETREGMERMLGKYSDLAYKCGMYHALGKALVPPEYQLWQEDFTEEEQALYKKYTTDGRLLVAGLQDGTAARSRMKDDLVETPTKNVPWLMIREACEQHMERFDGSGYPAGLKGSEISPVAQIVGIAKELDRLCSTAKSENPFDDAYRALTAQTGVAWSPELIEVLKASRSKCRNIYKKYIFYTQTLPATIPLVEKKKDRPMGLKYRPMVNAKGNIVAYEAEPWFGGVAGDPGATEGLAELTAMLKRRNMVVDVSFYFLYEAADAVLRMENCQLNTRGVVLQMLPDFYTSGTQLQRLLQLFKDQPIPKEKLLMTITAEQISKLTKANLEILGRYIRNGFCFVVDDYDPEHLPRERLKELGFSHVRPAARLYGTEETALLMLQLQQDGFVLVGGGVDSHELLNWVTTNKAAFVSGTITGIPVSEDELIRDALAREK